MAQTVPAQLTLHSPLFAHGTTIPKAAIFGACGGENRSPELHWNEPPKGTQSFALIVHDPDAPTGVGFFHWVMFNIPSHLRSLPSGAGARATAPAGAVLGHTDYGASEYGGPCPPAGDQPHRYNFTLYALDTKLDGSSTTTGALLRFMIRGHVLAEGTLTGLFGR
jgi:Raf kinase inhibitor-like YbhB/YbcL family protein